MSATISWQDVVRLEDGREYRQVSDVSRILPTYASGNKVYSMGYYGRCEIHFEPVRARYFRLRMQAAERKHLWKAGEIFLFEQKTGCCIDFASAMVVMLRTLRIPSRLACGFASAPIENDSPDRSGPRQWRPR